MATITKPAESQRRRRGHNFYPPLADLRKIPALYATEEIPTAEKVLPLKYFYGAFTWYIAEIDTAEWLAFGLTVNESTGDKEWGYIDLGELETTRAGGWGVIERDLYWDAAKASEVLS